MLLHEFVDIANPDPRVPDALWVDHDIGAVETRPEATSSRHCDAAHKARVSGRAEFQGLGEAVAATRRARRPALGRACVDTHKDVTRESAHLPMLDRFPGWRRRRQQPITAGRGRPGPILATPRVIARAAGNDSPGLVPRFG